MLRSPVLLFARYTLIAIVTAAAALWSPQVLAQLPADAEQAARGAGSESRIQDRLQDDTVIPQVSPQVEVEDLILQEVPEGAEDIRFNLETLQIDGVSVYTGADLGPVYADKLGTTVSLAEIYAVATALTNKYRNEGYILTQVIVPPQTIEDGVVRLQVVEGYVDRISVEGEDDQNALQLINIYASKIRTGNALNVRDLERYLLLISDLPGVEARSILSPSRTQAGAADLRIIITRDPFDALLAVDNHGSRFLGPVQLSAATALNSLFGHNESITGQFVLAPDSNVNSAELAYIALGYEQPIWHYGTKIQASFSHTDTEPGFTLDDFGVNGRSQFIALKILHPFIRSRSSNLNGHVVFDWRDVESKNILEPTRRDRIRTIRAGGRFEFLDTLFGVGINALNLEFAKGLNIFGSSDQGDLRLTRPFGDPDFFKMNAEVQRLQRIASGLNLLVVVRGQWSSNALLSSEEFGVGGINIGRAFDPSEVVGDDGIAGKTELQWSDPVSSSLIEGYQLFGFYDVGRVWNEDATSSSLKRDTLTSAGFGVRADITEETEAGLAVAFPLNRDVQTQRDDDPKIYFNLSRRF